jgi:phosphatidylserine decarboxylase
VEENMNQDHVPIKDRLFVIFQNVTVHRSINWLANKVANSKNVKFKNWLITKFMKKFGIELSEYEIQNPEDFASFNDFFTRALKPGVREFNPDQNIICSPIDGGVSQIGDITKNRLIQAKKHDYTLLDLTAGYEKFYHPFINGKFTTLYLSPKDYHRVHMPIDGKLISSLFIPGKFFSVNERSNEDIPNIYTRNTRLLCLFETDLGPMCVIFVGAMIVGQIVTKFHGVHHYDDEPIFMDHSKDGKDKTCFKKGDELGHFELGSTVILLFSSNAGLKWEEKFHSGSPIEMGSTLGTVVPKLDK